MTKPSPTLQADDDGRIVGHIMDLFFQAREAKRGLLQQWKRSYHMLHNRTWAPGRQSWMPTPEMADMWPIVASMVGWMTDQRPTFEVTPYVDPYSPYSDYLSNLGDDLRIALYASWQNNDHDAEIEKVLWDANTYGTGFFKTVWAKELGGGLGDQVARRVDPFTIYPDPQASSMEELTYIIEVRNLSLQEIERRWPGMADKVINQSGASDTEQAPTAVSQAPAQLPRANPAAISPNTDNRYGLPGQTTRLKVPLHHQGVQVIECWMRNPLRVDGNRVLDTWRVVCLAGGVVLMNEPALELWEHGQHPYDRVVLDDTGEFWGQSLVDLLTSPQMQINRILAGMVNNIDLHGNPVFAEDSRAGIGRTTITNQPGTRLTKSPGSQADWLTPPSYPAQASQLIQFFKAEMENISGLSAMQRGFTPSGRNSQGVMDSVQEAAFVRVRSSLRNLERALRRVGVKQSSLICEYYDTPRMIALLGEDGAKTSVNLKTDHFYLAGPDGKLPMRYQLSVAAGSSLPTSRQARASEADTLFAMGALDKEAVLEAHQWPNRQQITARVREMDAANGTLGQPPGARAAAGRTG